MINTALYDLLLSVVTAMAAIAVPTSIHYSAKRRQLTMDKRNSEIALASLFPVTSRLRIFFTDAQIFTETSKGTALKALALANHPSDPFYGEPQATPDPNIMFRLGPDHAGLYAVAVARRNEVVAHFRYLYKPYLHDEPRPSQLDGVAEAADAMLRERILEVMANGLNATTQLQHAAEAVDPQLADYHFKVHSKEGHAKKI